MSSSVMTDSLESADEHSSSEDREESSVSTPAAVEALRVLAEDEAESNQTTNLEHDEAVSTDDEERDEIEISTSSASDEADGSGTSTTMGAAAATSGASPEARSRKTFSFQEVCQIILENTQMEQAEASPRERRPANEGEDKNNTRKYLLKIIKAVTKTKYPEDHPCVADVFVAKRLWRIAAMSPTVCSLPERAILEIVLLAMVTNPGTLKIQCCGIYGLDSLADRFDKTVIVVITRAHEVILTSMRRFPNHDKLQGWGFRALNNLMVPKSNCRFIVEAGALEVASLAMNNPKLNAQTKEWAVSGVLCGLIHLCERRALAIALRSIIALYHKQDSRLQKSLMYLLYQLSSNYPKTLVHERESIVPGVVYIMQDYAYTGHVFGLGSGTLANLSFRGEGGIDAVLADMQQQPSNHTTQICSISALLYYTKKQKYYPALGRAIPYITAAMREFQGKCVILPQLAFIVLCNLTGVDKYCVIMAHDGVIDIASTIMTEHHRNHRIIQRIGFVLLSNLAASNRGNLRAKIYKAGGYDAMEGAMEMFPGDIAMQHFGRQALRHLSNAFFVYFLLWFLSSVDGLPIWL